MSIRNILVAYNGSESAATALTYAAGLAGDGQTHVTALLAHSTHEIVNSSAAWVPPKAREIIQQANAEILAEIETRFDTTRAALGLGDRLHFLRASGRVDAVLAECARSFDLIVAGLRQGEDIDEHVILHPDRIALLSGRPVLIVPPGCAAKTDRSHAVLAWDGSRAAARALSDSLVLLENHRRVTVVTVGNTPTPRPIPELMQHLDRHLIEARHEHIPAVPGIARALVAYCRAQAPGLLVMGAYEHSKFREDFLGGVTARVLREIPVPVLLSH